MYVCMCVNKYCNKPVLVLFQQVKQIIFFCSSIYVKLHFQLKKKFTGPFPSHPHGMPTDGLWVSDFKWLIC